MLIAINHQLSDGIIIQRLIYTIEFLDNHPLKPSNTKIILSSTCSKGLNIGYGIPHQDYYIPVHADFFTKPTIDSSKCYANQYEHKNNIVFSIDKKEKKHIPLIKNGQFQFDLFNTLFFHISRYEEFFAPPEKNGNAGWLKEGEHFLVKNNLYQSPIVDKLVKIFFEIITHSTINKPTTYSISHDVDFIRRFVPYHKFLLSLGASIVRRTPISQLRKNTYHFTQMVKGKAKDPYDYFSTLVRSEPIWTSKYLYFMAGGETKFDNAYSIKDKRINKIIELALKNGYTIGLHPSYNAGFKNELFYKEKELLTKTINSRIQHNRQHFLRFSWQTTPDILNKNGIKIDSSIGYARRLGFRCGTGFSYRMYNFKKEEAFDWIEQPLVLMDSSAIHAVKAPKMLHQYFTDFINQNKWNTHIEQNFHNSNFDTLTKTGQELDSFYRTKLLELIKT